MIVLDGDISDISNKISTIQSIMMYQVIIGKRTIIITKNDKRPRFYNTRMKEKDSKKANWAKQNTAKD